MPVYIRNNLGAIKFVRSLFIFAHYYYPPRLNQFLSFGHKVIDLGVAFDGHLLQVYLFVIQFTFRLIAYVYALVSDADGLDTCLTFLSISYALG